METSTPPQTKETTETKTPIQKLGNRVTDAVVIAVASTVAYLCSFLYERGYTSYFGIPQEFINVSLINLLIFAAGIVSILWGVWVFYDAVFPFTRPKHPYLAIRVPFVTGLFLFLVILPPFVLAWNIWFFIFTFSVWFLVVFVALIWPLITYRKIESWTERYDKHFEKWLKTETPITLQTHIGNRLGNRNIGFLIFLAFYSTSILNLAGGFKAEYQVEFLVTNTTPAMVVLKVYGDNMICAPFDRNTKEVKKSFSIHKVAADSNLVMNLEKVGPLKPVEKLSSEIAVPTPIPAPIISPTPSPTLTPQPSPETSPEATPTQPPEQ